MRRFVVSLSTVLVLGAAAACGGGSDEASGTGASGGQKTYELEMGMAAEGTFTAEWWGWLAAREMGYYKDQGLTVKFTPAGGSGTVIEQLAAGNLDAGNPSMPSVGEGLLAGIPLVNTFTYSTGAIFGIFTPESTGISDIAGLKGKRIGISEPGGGEVAFLEAALRAEGIDPIGDVKLIPIGDGGPDTFQAIEDKKVEAYSTAYNDIFALQAEGLSLKDLTPAKFNVFPARGIITTERKLQGNEEAFKRLARGTAMGIHFCFANLDACEAMLRKEVPEVWKANAEGVSQGSLRYELSQKQVKPKDPARIGAHDQAGTEEFIATIASTMENAPKVDTAKFLNQDFLDYANDFDRAKVEADAAAYKE